MVVVAKGWPRQHMKGMVETSLAMHGFKGFFLQFLEVFASFDGHGQSWSEEEGFRPCMVMGRR